MTDEIKEVAASEESGTSLDLLKEAQTAADRLEAANKEAREILTRNEELAARRLLGGETPAIPTPVKKEETPQEYAKRIISGKI